MSAVLATVLLVIAGWFVLSVVLTVALLTWAWHRDVREDRDGLDAELRDLIEQHRT